MRVQHGRLKVKRILLLLMLLHADVNELKDEEH